MLSGRHQLQRSLHHCFATTRPTSTALRRITASKLNDRFIFFACPAPHALYRVLSIGVEVYLHPGGNVEAAITEFKWEKKCSTGILEIDAQHQYLFALTNRLLRNVAENVSLATIGVTIAQLEDYVEENFRREEAMLRRVKYEGFDKHVEQHQRLRAQLSQYATRLQDQSLSATDFAGFMQLWLSRHILREDMKYLPAVMR
jgi:hemerythrin-like metal-binding protein